MNKIVLRGLTKVFLTGYGPVTALSSLDLVVHEGEFFVLLGPSGCGKTTLVRIMAGLDRHTSGEMTIARTNAGKPLTAMVCPGRFCLSVDDCGGEHRLRFADGRCGACPSRDVQGGPG